ncbi:MAG: alpha/beta fold hydrolase [Alphaproteobacteria bacterium]|nr:alpha/beta fold hydrolase [Alphaproteobacteria bacterium]
MSSLAVDSILVNDKACRVWREGSGAPLGFLAGFGGLPQWIPFLDRLAEARTVIVPSLPGFPGGLGHADLDSHLDWVLATHDALVAAGLAGADLVAASVAGALAADVAGIFPGIVKRLVLMAPFGLYDDGEPTGDPWAQKPPDQPGALCAKPEAWTAMTTLPEGGNALEWQIEGVRANEAAARFLWPLGDTRLAKRLGRITQPTLLLWGEGDRIIPPAYAGRFQAGIKGPTSTVTIPGAGHLAYLDQPEAAAKAILSFLG